MPCTASAASLTTTGRWRERAGREPRDGDSKRIAICFDAKQAVGLLKKDESEKRKGMHACGLPRAALHHDSHVCPVLYVHLVCPAGDEKLTA